MWSKSKLKSFRECPHKYKLSYIEKIEMPKAEALDKGIKLHDAFHQFFVLFDGDIDSSAKLTISKTGLDEAFMARYGMHFDNFINNCKEKHTMYGKEQFLPAIVEEKMTCGEWVGIVDRIDAIDDNIVVIDYKTSTGINLAGYHDELLLYAWLYQQRYGKTPTHIGIFFTGNGILEIEAIKESDIKENLEDLDRERRFYEKAIGDGNMPVTPGTHCKWCSYKDTEHCTKKMRE